jgi:predicted PP-loop superfamily ATPase
MKRCANCILPHTYPGITFDESGTCNHCITYKERKYLGGDALKERIESFLKNVRGKSNSYDCVIGLSGGRDSSYLIYYLVKRLNLNVLAYSIDNGFIPEQTIKILTILPRYLM